MTLDTKQRRGSAMNISSPWRVWVAEPSGDVDYAERLSMLKFCSSIIDETIQPEVPGIEYVWRGHRLHWVWRGSRLHWVGKEEL